MKISTYIIILASSVIAIFTIGYFFWNSAQVNEQDTTFNVVMEDAGTSGLQGTATITNIQERTHVKIKFQESPDGSLPAQIQRGDCDSLRGVIYPLTDVENGLSETIIDAPIDTFVSNLPLAVRVQKSDFDGGTTISCGNILLDTE